MTVPEICAKLKENTHEEVLYESTDSKVATLTMKDPLVSSRVELPLLPPGG